MQIYKVIVIVDPDFGDRLAAIPSGIPVWTADTPANKPVALRHWKARSDDNHLTGITTLQIVQANTSEENLLDVFYAIDLHHGPESTDNPYMQVEVIGTEITDRIRNLVSKYAFDDFVEKANGFIATRNRVPGPD